MKSILRLVIAVAGIATAVWCEKFGLRDPAAFWFMGAVVGIVCGRFTSKTED